MVTIDDLIISLCVLTGVRLIAALIFAELFYRERKNQYAALFLGWLVYAIGPVFGIMAYRSVGNSNHPLFGYSAAVGTLLLMFGVLLYLFKPSLKRLSLLLCLFVLGFGFLLAFFPNMGGHFGVLSQALMLFSTLVVIIFKRKWLISISGKNSYNWLGLFLLAGIFQALAFSFAFPQFPISVKFFQTFLVNLLLLVFFLHFDREQAFRKLLRSEAKITASLREKDALFKEVHHRVKNNMAIIEALLSLQSPAIENPEVRNHLTETRNRIRAMSLVHEQLYLTKDFSRISFSDYVRNLTQHILTTLGGGIELVLDTESFDLEPDTLIPCGLIINEIISNSFKHAFETTGQKKIELSARREKNGNVVLIIKDNGKGLASDVDINHATGLGLKLVKNLILQLDGTMKINNKKGTQFSFFFPEKIIFAGRD